MVLHEKHFHSIQREVIISMTRVVQHTIAVILICASLFLFSCDSKSDKEGFTYKAYDSLNVVVEEGVFVFEVDGNGYIHGKGTSTSLGETPLSGHLDGAILFIHLTPDNFTDVGIWFDGSQTNSQYSGDWGRTSIAGNGTPVGNFRARKR